MWSRLPRPSYNHSQSWTTPISMIRSVERSCQGMSSCYSLQQHADHRTRDRNYTSLSGFQIFCPNHAAVSSTRLQVPLEVLIDRRCESDEFERLVPQTDATFHYDKFNRLRLRNEVTSVVGPSLDTTPSISRTHLQDQTVYASYQL